jgi:hypothetical protein
MESELLHPKTVALTQYTPGALTISEVAVEPSCHKKEALVREADKVCLTPSQRVVSFPKKIKGFGWKLTFMVSVTVQLPLFTRTQ